MSESKRKLFTGQQKAKIALESVKETKTINEIAQEFGVHPTQSGVEYYQGTPEIFNTGQGSQFTSDSFTGLLIKNDITIGMDGRGRALDNIFVEGL